MFQRIKSPKGETVTDESLGCGVEYMTEEALRFQYRIYIRKFLDVGLAPMSFANWLEAQGVRIV
jgi:hypothetical protein